MATQSAAEKRGVPKGMKEYEVVIGGTKTVLQMDAEDHDARFPNAKEVAGRSAQDIPGGMVWGMPESAPPDSRLGTNTGEGGSDAPGVGSNPDVKVGPDGKVTNK